MSDTSSHQLSPFRRRRRRRPIFPCPRRRHAVERLSQVVADRELEQIGRAVISAGEAAYHWIIETDEISWSANSADVLGCDLAALAAGEPSRKCSMPTISPAAMTR